MKTKTVNAGRCAACNKPLGSAEHTAKGYASGEELGLCLYCASFVNTRAAIRQAIEKGMTVYSRTIPGDDEGWVDKPLVINNPDDIVLEIY